MKRFLTCVLAGVLFVSLVFPAAAFHTVLSTQNLTVDGQKIACEKYNIDGSNYFKLRDIAYLLNGTGSQFSVGFEDGVVSISTGAGYEALGTELAAGADKSATAQPSAQTIMINGEKRSDLSVYNIGGNNFFKLRDLGDSLGFFVDYDAATATAIVQSGESPLDARQNQAMRDQMGNFYSSGCAAEAADAVYYAVRRYVEDPDGFNVKGLDGKYSLLYSIVKRYDNGKAEEIYTAAEGIDKLSVDGAGNLYFIQGTKSGKLLKMDLNTRKTSVLYTCPGDWSCETYLLYDGKYIVATQKIDLNSANAWMYKIECIDGASRKTLLDERGPHVQKLTTSLYAYDGKLYYLYNYSKSENDYANSLYALDLQTGKKELCIDGSSAARLYLGEIAYRDDRVWYLGAEGGVADWVLKKSSLRTPESETVVAGIPAAGQELYTNLYANGEMLYYQSSGASKLWRISQDGKFSVIAAAPTPYYESSVVTRQGTAILGIPRVINLINGRIPVIRADGTQTNYLNFLGYPDWEKDLNF